MKVSVCITAYNHEKFIAEAIESVLAQRAKFDFEILIGEDDSADGTRNVVKRYKEKYPDVIRLFLNSRENVIYIHGQPTGRGNLINLLKNAEGEYLTLLDGDDYWTDPDKLQKQADILERNPNFAGCFHETQVMLENGEPGKIYGREANDVISAEDTLATLSPFHTSSFVFRKDALQFPDWFSRVVSGDMALFSIVAAAGPLVKAPGIMSVYRKHNKGISSSSHVVNNFHADRIELIKHLNEFHRYKFQMKAKKIIDFHKDKTAGSDALKKEMHREAIGDWRTVELPEDVATIKTMLTLEERQLLYLLARDYWTGAGAIVDGGCFLGGSTLPLARGVLANGNNASKEKVIHSYDLFIADSHQCRNHLKSIGDFSPGDSLRPVFDKNTSAVSNLLDVHQGDLRSFTWQGDNIEILFLDISKSWELNDHIVREFFPRLMPDHSIVIQQDFVHPTCPWLAITMEFFSEYFEPVAFVPDNSLVFKLIKKIPGELINGHIISQLKREDKLYLMDRALQRYEKLLKREDLVELECARCILKLWLEGPDTARQELTRIEKGYSGSPRLARAVQWVEQRLSELHDASIKQDQFINIELSPENMDLFPVRTGILGALKDFLPQCRGVFLDIGCGEMPYKPLILQNEKITHYIGLDIENPKYQKNVRPDLFWDGEHIPLDDETVDAVAATELFEHLPDLISVLREIKRVLKPGGRLFFTVPFLWPLHDMPHDEYRYTPFSLKRHLRNAGFHDSDVKALGGWDASLAQMIGLWMKRRPMSEKSRSDFSSVLFPFYQDLLTFESQNKTPVYEDMSRNSMMITGLTGIAQKPANQPARRPAKDAAVECPVCGGTYGSFLPYGVVPRPNALCPGCGSLESHRLLWLYLKARTDLFTAGRRVLEIAPTKAFSGKLRAQPNIDYLSIDKHSSLAMQNMDITSLDLPDQSFDVVLCYHVLEHVNEDRRAMREILRVLKPDGWAILQVPLKPGLEKTVEGNHISDPDERKKLFGQEDHIRYYGADYRQRLEEQGFSVIVDPFARSLTKEETNRYAVSHEECLYICRKPGPGACSRQQGATASIGSTQSALSAAPADRARQQQSFSDCLNISTSQKKKRIVIVQGGFPSVSATFILDQITGLIDRGFDIENWATYDPKAKTIHDEINKYDLIAKTKYIKFPPEKLKDQPHEWLTHFVTLNSISNLDDVCAFHVHYGVNFNLLETIFKLTNKFVLVSFHGYDASRYIKQKGDACYSYLFQRADFITTPSLFMKNELTKRGCNSEKIHIHRYGIDMNKFKCAARTFGDKKIIFLTVGRFVEKKGIEYSIRAFAMIKDKIDAEYRIIGEGELEQSLIELIREYNLEQDVKLLGPKTKEEVQSEMKTADIFVLTSVTAADGDSEGIPVSLTEAHAMGLPVISTYHAGIPELVSQNETGLLSAERNIDGIAANMLTLASNADLRKKMSIAARARVLQEFNIVTLNDTLAALLAKGMATEQDAGDQDPARSLYERLERIGWANKYEPYRGIYSGCEFLRQRLNPAVSIIVISWRLHPDTIKNFEILQEQRDQDFELIFVDNGGKKGEFDVLKPYCDTYVRLNTNSGAYLARNVGSVFAKAPILFFLEDDGIPKIDLVQSHLTTHSKYDVIAVRGVYRPKNADNPFNKLAKHYYLGDKPFPVFADLEGNTSYRAAAFYAVGGWDDEIIFGGGGVELAIRLFEYDSDFRKQIYAPSAVIYHDYATDQKHLNTKKDRQESSKSRLRQKHPCWDNVMRKLHEHMGREDLLICGDSKSADSSHCKTENVSTRKKPSVSIVIPALNAQETLDLCLNAVAKLSYPKDKLEVIVVDNGSTDASMSIARKYNVKLMQESSIKSSYAARNAGIKAAAGDLIAFTDADCIVTPDWLTHLVSYWHDETIGCFAGEIEAYQPEDLIETFSDRAGILRQKGTLSCAYLPYTQTANSAYRKTVFDRVGLFDPEMTSGGDADLSWRMQKQLGLAIRFIPEALVYHKHRTSIQGLFNQFQKYEQGKLLWRTSYPDYALPSISQRKKELADSIERVKTSLAPDTDKFVNGQIDFVGLLTPFLRYIMSLGTFKARTEIEDSMISTPTPLISVVIPTYNRAALLKESLESLTRQTIPLTQFEVVVIDDGSSDVTRELCAEFSTKLRLVYKHIENSGIAAAKNIGISLSSSPLILFFDDDDIAHRQLLEEHLKFHKAYPDENIAVLGYTTWASTFPKTEMMRYVTDIGMQLFSYPKIAHGQFLSYKHFWGGRSSCKKSFMTTHGIFREEFRFGSEDIELGYRLDRFGLKVVFNQNAISYMNRPITFDDFCRRCEKQGRSQYFFSKIHPDQAIQQYCMIPGAEATWRMLEPSLELKVKEIRDLETRINSSQCDDKMIIKNLYDHYAWVFNALKIKGIVEAMLSEKAESSSARHQNTGSLSGQTMDKRISPTALPTKGAEFPDITRPSSQEKAHSILIVAKELPFYDRSSGNFRLFQILRILISQGHRITFLARPSFRKIDDSPYIRELEQMGITVVKISDEKIFLDGTVSPSLKQLLSETTFDIAYLMFYSVADLYLERIRACSSRIRIIVDSVDLHFLRECRHNRVIAREHQAEYERNKARELSVYRRADLVLMITEVDRQALLSEAPQAKTAIIPNIHPSMPSSRNDYESRSDIVFVGGYTHEPNIDAVEYFCEHIWPLVAPQLPKCRLIIAGNAPPPRITRFASERIIVTGYVPDLFALLDQCRVSIAPLRYGAGMKGKVGEALACGLPVVASTIGAEGMGLIHGEHLLIADTPDAFANSLVSLYNDGALWKRLSVNGKEFVERNFSPEAVSEMLRSMLTALFTNRSTKNPKTIAIRICTPSRGDIGWGDTYFGQKLTESFLKAGHQCQLYCMDEWYTDRNHDVSIHLKGLSRYVPLRRGFNIIWIISHPELITKEEVEQYDLILCASKIFTDHLKNITSVPCYYMPQATDDSFFEYAGDSVKKSFDLLFVGNNYEFRHGRRRRIIQDLLDTQKEYNLRVIGPHWEGYLDTACIIGASIESERLPEIYSKAKINLNDHHSAMTQYGFINNRTFDLAALKQFQISNYVPGIEEFGIVTYKNPEDLKNKLDYYLANDGARTAVAALNYEKCREHTFSNTARKIIKYLNLLQESKDNAGVRAVNHGHSPLQNLRDAKTHKGQKMKVVFAVTETGEMSTAGDYFTAMELGLALRQRYGWDVELVPANRWYDVADADVLVAMTHVYDLTRLGLSGANMIKICWMRNWFDGWATQPFFHRWDIYLASSLTAVNYMKERYRVTAHLFRIATHPKRFKPLGQVKDIDYCFTGSYWNDPRDIEKLDPETIGLKFALFGKNWDGHPQFKKYYKGFVPYLDLPKIYNQSKILVDDANRVTKQWGSVNSRVFDALATGTLVITNSEESSRDAFENQLPVYKTPAALKEMLRQYLDSPQEYENKLNALREIVLKYHTYEVRAQEFSDILSNHTQNERAKDPNYFNNGDNALSGTAIAVSIIIPVFNKVDLTRQCLLSLFANTHTPGYEIIIVDNGSTDGTGTFLSEMAEAHENLKIILNRENLGFAKANNLAARSATGEYLLFLNNDTEPQPGWLSELLEIAQNDQTIGAVAPKLLYPNMMIQHAGIIMVNDTQNGDPLLARNRYAGQPATLSDANQPMVYQALTAACLLVRKSAFEGAGGFDESYWNGYEDVDLCFKLRENGWNLVYQPRSVVIHHESQSGPERFAMARQNISMLHRKWLDKIKPDYIINKDGTVVPTAEKRIHPYNAPARPAGEINHPGKVQDGLVSIVILTFNQLKFTKECVESIRRHTPNPHEIIFIDNGSADGTVKWLKKLAQENSHYRLIENERNLGFAKGCNQGITASNGEYILLLNNDVVVTENWLSGMLECLKSADEIGIVGPMTNNISGQQKVEDVGYTSVNQFADYAKKFAERNRHRRIPLRRIVGFCMLFRRALAEQIGLLDESFGTGNFEDDDYCYRATQAGYQNMIAGDVFIHHYGSRSFIGNNINYANALYGNNRIFNRKWGQVDTQAGPGKALVCVQTLESADELYQKGQTDEAIKKLLEGIQKSPDEEKIYYFFAEILIDSKRYQDALDAANGLPEKARQSARYFEIVGYCKEGLSLLDEAEACADKALSLKRDAAAALNLKGLIAYKRGDKASARGYFNKAVKADSGYAEAYTNLGVLKWAEDDKKTALDLLEKGCILSPTSADNITLYHSAISGLGEFARAEVVLREAKDLHPMNKKISFLLIDALIQQSKYSVALAEIERAIITFGIDDGILAAAVEVRGKIGSHDKAVTQKHGKTLSLVMIVKNEEQYLAKCLMSVKPIAHEMIVVDTGSTDRTKNIAKAFGAKVFDFEWNADFAEARNFSLSKASGDWIFVMDADEVLSPLDYPFFDNILKKTAPPRTAYSINTRNYSNSAADEGWSPNDEKYARESAGCGWFPSKKVRLFPRDAAIRWVNPVHEMVEPSLAKRGIPIRSSDAVIHHYGRLNQEKLIAKHEHYYALGKKKLAEKSNDSKALFELGVQAAELKKYDEAIELFKLVIALKPEDDLAYYNLGANYLALRKYNEALIASKKAVELAPGRKEAATNYATSELLVGDVNHAAALARDVVDKNPDYPVGLALLGVIHFIRGDYASGWRYFEKLRTAKFNFLPFIHDTATRLKESERRSYAKKMIDAARTYGYTNPEIEQLRAECDDSMVPSS